MRFLYHLLKKTKYSKRNISLEIILFIIWCAQFTLLNCTPKNSKFNIFNSYTKILGQWMYLKLLNVPKLITRKRVPGTYAILLRTIFSQIQCSKIEIPLKSTTISNEIGHMKLNETLITYSNILFCIK